MSLRNLLSLVTGLLALSGSAWSAGHQADLIIADGGKTRATVVVAAKAGPWEKRAAQDLVTYIFRITNARPVLVESDEAAQQALRGTRPVQVVGEAALVTAPELRDELKSRRPSLATRSRTPALYPSGLRGADRLHGDGSRCSDRR